MGGKKIINNKHQQIIWWHEGRHCYRIFLFPCLITSGHGREVLQKNKPNLNRLTFKVFLHVPNKPLSTTLFFLAQFARPSIQEQESRRRPLLTVVPGNILVTSLLHHFQHIFSEGRNSSWSLGWGKLSAPSARPLWRTTPLRISSSGARARPFTFTRPSSVPG